MFLLAVPRVFEKVFNSAQQQAAASGAKSRIFDRGGRHRHRLQPRASVTPGPARRHAAPGRR